MRSASPVVALAAALAVSGCQVREVVAISSELDAGSEAGDSAADALPAAATGPERCVAAGGRCVLGGAPCANVGPEDCNPINNPGGAFCCLPVRWDGGGGD